MKQAPITYSLVPFCLLVSSSHLTSLGFTFFPCSHTCALPKCMEPKSLSSKPLLGVEALVFTHHLPLLCLFAFIGLGVTRVNPSVVAEFFSSPMLPEQRSCWDLWDVNEPGEVVGRWC